MRPRRRTLKRRKNSVLVLTRFARRMRPTGDDLATASARVAQTGFAIAACLKPRGAKRGEFCGRRRLSAIPRRLRCRSAAAVLPRRLAADRSRQQRLPARQQSADCPLPHSRREAVADSRWRWPRLATADPARASDGRCLGRPPARPPGPRLAWGAAAVGPPAHRSRPRPDKRPSPPLPDRRWYNVPAGKPRSLA